MLMKTSYHNRNKNAVTLTTIHGAKGLEFNRVFVMGMVENIFPTKQAEIKASNGDISLRRRKKTMLCGYDKRQRICGFDCIKK